MYSYKLYTGKEGRRTEYDAKYTASELAEMTTFQLRDICFRKSWWKASSIRWTATS